MELFRMSSKRCQSIQSEFRSNVDETVDDFCREVMKALWHAYDMLDTLSSGTVHVSQLKVITSNVGMKLGNDKAETILDKSGASSMKFKTYFDIVKSELLDKQEKSENPDALGNRLNGIVKTCWTMCNFERRNQCKSFTNDHALQLWRLYNFLSETDEAGNPVIPVKLDPEEAAILLRDFIDITGQKSKEQQIKLFVADSKDSPLTFTDFLNVFEKGYTTGLSGRGITQGLNSLYEIYILNVLKKGMMWKRGFKVKSWKERYLILTPTQLRYFVGSDEKVQKGCIEFDADCSVEVPPDRPTHRPNRFVVNTKKKPYEMSAADLKTKNEWVSAIQLALSRVGKDPNIQKDAAHERCMARAERRRLAAEEEKKRRKEAELLKRRQDELDEAKKKRQEDEELLRARLSELEEEKKRREEAEARWQEEQALREAEQERLRELEAIKKELERLLEEERQAKRDEEIVRNLQSRLLEEEFEKREELERLKQQQEELLRAEREQKAVLESDRHRQEQMLAEAQARLNQLEQDRTAASQKMQDATEKLQRAEKDRQIMEEKVKLWKTPVGLARPLQPKVNPLITHRGQGAFCEKDFFRKVSGEGIEENQKNENDRDSLRRNERSNIDNIDEKEQMKESTAKADIHENANQNNESDNEAVENNVEINLKANHDAVDSTDIDEKEQRKESAANVEIHENANQNNESDNEAVENNVEINLKAKHDAVDSTDIDEKEQMKESATKADIHENANQNNESDNEAVENNVEIKSKAKHDAVDSTDIDKKEQMKESAATAEIHENANQNNESDNEAVENNVEINSKANHDAVESTDEGSAHIETSQENVHAREDSEERDSEDIGKDESITQTEDKEYENETVDTDDVDKVTTTESVNETNCSGIENLPDEKPQESDPDDVVENDKDKEIRESTVSKEDAASSLNEDVQIGNEEVKEVDSSIKTENQSGLVDEDSHLENDFAERVKEVSVVADENENSLPPKENVNIEENVSKIKSNEDDVQINRSQDVN